jgi:hypothetical protein
MARMISQLSLGIVDFPGNKRLGKQFWLVERENKPNEGDERMAMRMTLDDFAEAKLIPQGREGRAIQCGRPARADVDGVCD